MSPLALDQARCAQELPRRWVSDDTEVVPPSERAESRRARLRAGRLHAARACSLVLGLAPHRLRPLHQFDREGQRGAEHGHAIAGWGGDYDLVGGVDSDGGSDGAGVRAGSGTGDGGGVSGSTGMGGS